MLFVFWRFLRAKKEFLRAVHVCLFHGSAKTFTPGSDETISK
jgi:hypothetical protein